MMDGPGPPGHPDPWWSAGKWCSRIWFRPRAEAGRETVTVNLERIGGRQLIDGIIPVRCADIRQSRGCSTTR
jgi:hypothetical protein